MKFLVKFLFLLPSCFCVFAEEPIVDPLKLEKNPEEAATSNATYLLCKNKNVVRTIRIEMKGRGCIVYYTKEGEEKVVGKSGTENICREVFEKIRVNLEKAGDWKCKDISEARVSISTTDM